MRQKIPFRPLGPVRSIVENAGLTITYAYDDLVFIESNAFLLRFDDQIENHLFLHPNTEGALDELKNLFNTLTKSANAEGFKITHDKPFSILQKADENTLEISFL